MATDKGLEEIPESMSCPMSSLRVGAASTTDFVKKAQADVNNSF